MRDAVPDKCAGLQKHVFVNAYRLHNMSSFCKLYAGPLCKW